MDIHAPEKPIHSIREFGVLIAVVTIGILIALALEGLRELVHDRNLVRETRENFRAELRDDLEHSDLESARVNALSRQIDQLVQNLPTLQQHPESIQAHLPALHNSGYFFADTSWQAALSTGALAHMRTDEIQDYAGAFYTVRVYAGLQQQCLPIEDRARIFFASHPNPTPAQVEDGIERILLFQNCERGLVQVGGELHAGIQTALKL